MKRLACVLLLAAACGKGSGGAGGSDAVLAAWRSSALEVGSFASVDSRGFGDASCRAGKVKGIDATLCDFKDADAAKRAEAAGLAQVQDTTGLAIADGKVLLVLADRARSDPSGKRINEIAKAFRNR
jgi:hypothetical protein